MVTRARITAIAIVSLLVGSFGALAQAEEGETFLHTVEIEDPSGEALSRFARALEKTARREPGAITRIAHYGDSIVVVDQMTASMRELYQKRYGDAGLGFVLALRPWRWYRHAGVRQGASDGWQIFRSISGGPEDRLYGYGGVTFVARWRQREVWFDTRGDDGEAGQPFSRLEVFALEQPDGGSLELVVDGEREAIVETAAEKVRSGFHEVELEDAPHKVELRTSENQPVRLFGVSMERQGPGVVYDSLGLNGTCMTVLGRMNMDHLGEQIAHRDVDLVILGFGTGEAKRPGLVARYERTIRPILEDFRRVAPETSCLILGPIDRGFAKLGPRSSPMIPQIIEVQRKLAAEVGCAFYDSFAAMGGDGSVERWVNHGLIKRDRTHPTERGAAILADGLFHALERAVGREEGSAARDGREE